MTLDNVLSVQPRPVLNPAIILMPLPHKYLDYRHVSFCLTLLFIYFFGGVRGGEIGSHICNPGWLGTMQPRLIGNPPASTFWVLGLQVGTTTKPNLYIVENCIPSTFSNFSLWGQVVAGDQERNPGSHTCWQASVLSLSYIFNLVL